METWRSSLAWNHTHSRWWSGDSKPGLSFLRGGASRDTGKQGFSWLTVVSHLGVSRFCTVNAALQASSGHATISWHLQVGLDSPSLSSAWFLLLSYLGMISSRKPFLTRSPHPRPKTWMVPAPPPAWARQHFPLEGVGTSSHSACAPEHSEPSELS